MAACVRVAHSIAARRLGLSLQIVLELFWISDTRSLLNSRLGKWKKHQDSGSPEASVASVALGATWTSSRSGGRNSSRLERMALPDGGRTPATPAALVLAGGSSRDAFTSSHSERSTHVHRRTPELPSPTSPGTRRRDEQKMRTGGSASRSARRPFGAIVDRARARGHRKPCSRCTCTTAPREMFFILSGKARHFRTSAGDTQLEPGDMSSTAPEGKSTACTR